MPTHLPISHIPKDSMNAPKGLCNVEGDAGDVRPMSPTQAIRHPIVFGSEGMNAMGLGPSRRASTTTGQEVIDLLHKFRIFLQLGVSVE